MDLRFAFPFAVTCGVLIGLGTARLKPADSSTLSHTTASVGLIPVEEVVRWDLPIVWNESVQRFVTLFETKQQDRMALYLKRAGRYEGMIRSKLRERGMPEDLVYLSMIESGFNPEARSKAQAVGLWQFIADTGRRYGLRIDGYVDERRDPEKSTEAALRYLQDLHRQFGSWSLAAAAYNTGENRVARIMREETGAVKGVESDFWKIRGRLPSETREYVPLIYAAALIGKEPHKYGLTTIERWLPLETEAVSVPGGTPLAAVAKAVGVTDSEIRKLNPHLLRDVTPPGTGYDVRIPAGRAEAYAANIERARAEVKVAAAAAKPAPKSASKSAAAAKRHTVRKGDSLSTIARRHGVTVTALQRANNLGKRTMIRPGQVLRIPA